MTQRQQQALNPETDANRDPITGTPGSHPVGTGLGAAAGGIAGGIAAGAATGAATGTAAGPLGTLAGAAVGAVLGGLAGKAVAEGIDPTAEDAYWRDNYKTRPYVTGETYDDFGPAYQYGVSAYSAFPNRTFDDIEPDLRRDWTQVRGTSNLEWDRAKLAAKDSWQRVSDAVERAVPGDSDRDGK